MLPTALALEWWATTLVRVDDFTAPNLSAPRLRSLACVFARFGNFTFGGGSATIATLQSEVVEQRRWLEHDPFHLCYAISRLTPGTNLLAFCVAAG